MFSLSVNAQLPPGASSRADEIMKKHLMQFSFTSAEENEFVKSYLRNAEPNPVAFLGVDPMTPSKSATPPDVPREDDDENDVIFISQYQRTTDNFQKKNSPRRNPVRKARNAKRGFHLQNEHLLEEDFGILDQIDEDNLLICKREKVEVKEPLKTWPINAYERPEYNPRTNEVEPLDCLMKNSETNLKKPKLTVPRKTKAKPKKKYQTKKRIPTTKKPIEMVPAKELTPVVEETLEMVRELSAGSFGKKFGLDLLNNQTMLLAIIKGMENEENQRSDSSGPSDSSSNKRK
ncbi:uncharacterized protein LOC125503285 [Dendroctonus ponderosae]|uniref:uncharacterized protein LOC109542376 n=1 Tax=Dendroctonus ponderosae TaxID=77166 RepID=UPI0020358F73|nr:uncharacterized protein LOC109542376 [Dendroctonus ponderosae]XP_048519309.1 uncharacterized protein LOC125503285 [Dendroctonus ponderosae]